MPRCPMCKSREVTVETKQEETDPNQVSRLVLRSWLSPGGILKNRKQYRTTTTCTCRKCGHTWEIRSGTEILMAVTGAFIFLCLIILSILGSKT